jgi:hypothetical protein
MPRNVAELAHRLAREAEAVCRHYLSNGRRVGNYWQVGDVRNTSGRSMFVRLKDVDAGGRRAGKWTDAATGQHGDLLDVIRETCGLVDFHDVIEEARRFLSLPRSEPGSDDRPHLSPVPTGSPEPARRLFGMSQPIAGTVVETYLRRRGITNLHGIDSLRFHPRCYYRPEADAPTETWPAMIAAVTDLQGHITGVHRTWLDPSGRDKAPVDTPRRAMGHLLGHAVRFRPAIDVMAAGEGIETMLGSIASYPAWRWSRHSRPHILEPSCSRQRCAVSTSSVTTIPRAMLRWQDCLTGRSRPGSRRWCCHRRAEISTRICGISTSTRYAQRRTSRSPLKT